MSSLIELIGITKIYHTKHMVHKVLDNINLKFKPTDFTAIMGASGSGKSTLINIMGLLDTQTSGQYLFEGQNITLLNKKELSTIRNQKLGFIFQSFFLLPRMTALQNVMLPLFYRGLSTKAALPLAFEMLARVGLSSFAKHLPDQLSGGQQQRVAIARALVGNPTVILADEPTGALDSKTSQEIMNLLIELNEIDKKTIIIITHDGLISQQCKTIIEIKDGRISEVCYV